MEFNLEFKENFIQRKCNENFEDFKKFLFNEMKFKENKNIMKIYYKMKMMITLKLIMKMILMNLKN
jgi:hypothetical protein